MKTTELPAASLTQQPEMVICAKCGKGRPLDTLESRETFVCRYCLSTEPLPTQGQAPEQQGDSIALAALRSVLERLRSKNANPNNDWYVGWNAALDCLIHDIDARVYLVNQKLCCPK